MRLRLPAEQAGKVVSALAQARDKEIGGQLFGEQILPSDFRITELSIQRRRGTFARFVVDLMQAARDAASFFTRTDHRYARFNYLGEWHSHPSFPVLPSATDKTTMRGLVDDADFKGNFAVLMIVKLDARKLAAGAWVFARHDSESNVHLEIES